MQLHLELVHAAGALSASCGKLITALQPKVCHHHYAFLNQECVTMITLAPDNSAGKTGVQRPEKTTTGPAQIAAFVLEQNEFCPCIVNR